MKSRIVELTVALIMIIVLMIAIKDASAQSICIENPAACADVAPVPVVQVVPPLGGGISPAPVVHNVFGQPEIVAKAISTYYPTQKSFNDMMNDLESMQGNYVACGSHVDGLNAEVSKLLEQKKQGEQACGAVVETLDNTYKELQACKANKRRKR